MLGMDIDVGRHREVGRPCVSDRSLCTQLLEAHVENVNLILGRALRRKRKTLGWERQRE
jgi:hypothetical protein